MVMDYFVPLKTTINTLIKIQSVYFNLIMSPNKTNNSTKTADH